MSRIAHVSDTHSKFYNLPKNTNIVLHTGDFVADPPSNSNPKDFGKIQMNIVKRQIKEIKSWIENRKYLFLQGNHDWTGPWELEDLLRSEGIDAHCIHDKTVSIDDVVFYGFPYMPVINGMFATETNAKTMNRKMDEMAEVINNLDQVDVIATHCGPKNVLDLSSNGNHYGNPAWEDTLFSKIANDRRPDYLCFGHVHHSYSISLWKDIVVSNAATRCNVLEIN